MTTTKSIILSFIVINYEIEAFYLIKSARGFDIIKNKDFATVFNSEEEAIKTYNENKDDIKLMLKNVSKSLFNKRHLEAIYLLALSAGVGASVSAP
jgi:hypothetical protein